MFERERRCQFFFFFFFSLTDDSHFLFSFRSLSLVRGQRRRRASVLFLFLRFHKPFVFSSPQETVCVARPFASLSGASLSRKRWRRESKKGRRRRRQRVVRRRSSSSSSVSRRLFCSLFSSLFLLSFPFSALLVTFSALSKAENTQSTRQIRAEEARGELKRSKQTRTKRDASSSLFRPPRRRSFSYFLRRGGALRCVLCAATLC